jgi:hypothetical protein
VKLHSLGSAQPRFANGFSGIFSFAANSVRENRIVEEYDRAPTIWQGSNGGRPYRVTASGVYELPFGAGRAFLNEGGLLAGVVGGWLVAGNYDYQPGALIGDWPNLFFYGDLEDIPWNPARPVVRRDAVSRGTARTRQLSEAAVPFRRGVRGR